MWRAASTPNRRKPQKEMQIISYCGPLWPQPIQSPSRKRLLYDRIFFTFLFLLLYLGRSPPQQIESCVGSRKEEILQNRIDLSKGQMRKRTEEEALFSNNETGLPRSRRSRSILGKCKVYGNALRGGIRQILATSTLNMNREAIQRTKYQA
jgi:hypothetical protein